MSELFRRKFQRRYFRGGLTPFKSFNASFSPRSRTSTKYWGPLFAVWEPVVIDSKQKLRIGSKRRSSRDEFDTDEPPSKKRKLDNTPQKSVVVIDNQNRNRIQPPPQVSQAIIPFNQKFSEMSNIVNDHSITDRIHYTLSRRSVGRINPIDLSLGYSVSLKPCRSRKCTFFTTYFPKNMSFKPYKYLLKVRRNSYLQSKINLEEELRCQVTEKNEQGRILMDGSHNIKVQTVVKERGLSEVVFEICFMRSMKREGTKKTKRRRKRRTSENFYQLRIQHIESSSRRGRQNIIFQSHYFRLHSRRSSYEKQFWNQVVENNEEQKRRERIEKFGIMRELDSIRSTTTSSSYLTGSCY